MIKMNFKNYQLKTFNYFKRELFIKKIKDAIYDSIKEVCGENTKKNYL